MTPTPDRAALRTIATAAPGVADEIARRLAHLTACEQLQVDGFRVDPCEVFDDEPPPDEAKIKATLGKLHHALSEHDLFDALDELGNANSAVVGLNRAETQALIGALSRDDLTKWNGLLGVSILGHGSSNDTVIALANSLLSKLGKDEVVRLTKYAKDKFPTLTVYGNTDHAALRLITCGGKFDFSAQLRGQHRGLCLAHQLPHRSSAPTRRNQLAYFPLDHLLFSVNYRALAGRAR